VILEGQIDLKDKATGEVIEAKAGDVLRIPKGEQERSTHRAGLFLTRVLLGTTVLFTSPSFGKGLCFISIHFEFSP
jgi:hypothetical protein